MATTAPSDAPAQQPQTAERLGGNVVYGPEFLEGLGETQKVASAVMAGVDRELAKRVSFAEAVKLLAGKLDLEAARTNAVKSHGRWGLVNALVKAGAVKDASEYGALFDKATINEADLLKVRAMIERGEKILPIFDAGEMTHIALCAVLFTEGGVRIPDNCCFKDHFRERSDYKNIIVKAEEIRRINPRDIPDLANLAKKSDLQQAAAFSAAYKAAGPLEPTGPRVTFTPDQLEVSRVHISATLDMQAFAKGEMAFVDPRADMIRFRTQIDAGLRKIAEGHANFDGMNDTAYRAFLDKAFAEKTIDKYMPDRRKATHYPNYALRNGGVPFLGPFLEYSREVFMGYRFPAEADFDHGSRISLG